MRAVPDHREGRTFGGVRGRIALALVVAGVTAATLGLALRDDAESISTGVVRIEPLAAVQTETATVAPAPESARMIYELHGLSRAGARSSALLARHGAAPKLFRVGDAIGPGVLLEAVAPGHVLLREGAALVRIDLPPRLGGSGEAVSTAERGLKPEPQPPTGELSAAQITGATPNRADPPLTLPGDE